MSAFFARVARRLRDDERGFSLVELIVSMALLSIVTAAMFSAVMVVQRSLGSAEATLYDLGDVRIGFNRTTQALRGAVRPPSSTGTPNPALAVARPNQVRFFAYLGTGIDAGAGPAQINIFVDAQNRLIEEVTPATGSGPSWTYASTPALRRTLATGVTDPAVFSYFVRDSATQDLVALSTPASGLGVDDRRGVVAVGLNLSVQSPGGSGNEPIGLQTRVRLPNAW